MYFKKIISKKFQVAVQESLIGIKEKHKLGVAIHSWLIAQIFVLLHIKIIYKIRDIIT